MVAILAKMDLSILISHTYKNKYINDNYGLYFSTQQQQSSPTCKKRWWALNNPWNFNQLTATKVDHTHCQDKHNINDGARFPPVCYCYCHLTNFINYILIFQVCIMSQKQKIIIIDIKNILNQTLNVINYNSIEQYILI